MQQPGVVRYGASHTGFRPELPGQGGGSGRQRADSIADAMLSAPAPITTSSDYRPVMVVTRHAATLEWLRSRFGAERVETWRVISHVSTPADIAGCIVIGALPLHLAAAAYAVGSISLPDLRPEQRGAELTLGEMAEAGVRLDWFVVRESDTPAMK